MHQRDLLRLSFRESSSLRSSGNLIAFGDRRISGPEIPREAGSCRRRRGGCRASSEGIPNRAMRPHMRMDARSYAERGIAGGAGMRRSAADAPRATVGSTDPNAERTAAKRGGARSGRPRRQSRDCRAGRTQAPTPLFVPGVRLGRYCPQIRGKHCMDRRYEKKWVNSRWRNRLRTGSLYGTIRRFFQRNKRQ